MSRPSVYEHWPMLGWRLSNRVKRAVRHVQLLQSSLLKPDAVYLERGMLNDDSLDLDQRLRKTTARLVLDVDDGIFLERPAKIDKLIEMSDHIIVSNPPIFEYVAERHAAVTIIPTAVSMERYQPRPEPDPCDRTVIGWIGTVPNMPFLKVCAGALRKLSQSHDFRLLIIGPTQEPLKTINLEGVDVEFRKWSPETEISDLHRMDIGLMPLPSGQDWMRYKAATKLVQYLAIGIPAVATPIGVNAEILRDNLVGFAASNEQQWIDGLEVLLTDAQLRKQMGSRGRERVANEFSVEANAPRLEAALSGNAV